jgi:hypothetical protein
MGSTITGALVYGHAARSAADAAEVTAIAATAATAIVLSVEQSDPGPVLSLSYTIDLVNRIYPRSSENNHPRPNSSRTEMPYTKAPTAVSSTKAVSSRNMLICAK